MPCYHPLQVFYSQDGDGKKCIDFSARKLKLAHDIFRFGIKSDHKDDLMRLPCGNCVGCRIDRSRQWAVRCAHEASLYEDNCYITLTFAPEHLPKDGSINKLHMQKFMKRLRKQFPDRRVRVFYSGEYGDKLGRPHYHAILFNFDFKDKTYWKTINGYKYYTSATLQNLWPFGHSVIGNVTFESAAYVARYVTKKITGKQAEDHYLKVDENTGEVKRLTAEFSEPSRMPGIGHEWIEKYGMKDIYPRDECIITSNGETFRCKVPRYYDKWLEKRDPVLFDSIKKARVERASEKEDDNTYERLLAKEKCQKARVKMLLRSIENS